MRCAVWRSLKSHSAVTVASHWLRCGGSTNMSRKHEASLMAISDTASIGRRDNCLFFFPPNTEVYMQKNTSKLFSLLDRMYVQSLRQFCWKMMEKNRYVRLRGPADVQGTHSRPAYRLNVGRPRSKLKVMTWTVCIRAPCHSSSRISRNTFTSICMVLWRFGEEKNSEVIILVLPWLEQYTAPFSFHIVCNISKTVPYLRTWCQSTIGPHNLSGKMC